MGKGHGEGAWGASSFLLMLTCLLMLTGDWVNDIRNVVSMLPASYYREGIRVFSPVSCDSRGWRLRREFGNIQNHE